MPPVTFVWLCSLSSPARQVVSSVAASTAAIELRQPVRGEISSAGDLAYTVGEAEIRDPTSRQVVRTQYLTIWKRQPPGEWKFVSDGGNRRP